MRIGLYVVTEAIEACGKSMEIVSLAEGQGGIFEDGALALQAMLKDISGESNRERFLYAASFENNELKLDRLIFALVFNPKENCCKLLTEPK